jgi:hydroxymethylpyrimidine/phosphomethylpyrimidine kinase
LFPLATIVTPNIPEAQAILGWTDSLAARAPLGVMSAPTVGETVNKAPEPPASPLAIHSVADMEIAAKKIFALGPAYVLIKGGHLALQGESDGMGEELVDVLYDGHKIEYIRGPHVTTENVHGTGCTLASAIAAELARGATVLQVSLSTISSIPLQSSNL